jgi:DHA2 family multidrug resistance protein-like MFS transporter
MQSATVIPTRAGRRQWAGLAVLALPTLLVALDINVLFLALPQLTQDLGVGSVEQLWITDTYGFMVAGLVITMGTLGDRIGRRALLLGGVAAFGALSVVAAYSVNPAMLIGARALLGIAGATLMPSTLALITTMFRDDRQRGTAIAIWATCQFAGAALGPVLGGVMLQHFWWGSIFLLSVPVAVLVLVFGPLLLPEFRRTAPGRLDPVSVLLSLLTVLPVVYGIKNLAAGTDSRPIAIAAIVVGLTSGYVFTRRQLTSADPLLDLRLFGRRSFSLILVALVVAGVVMAGIGLWVTQYLQSVLGYGPAESALLFVPMGLAVAVGTTLTPMLVRFVEPARAIPAGLIVSAVGAGTLTLVEDKVVLVVVAIAVLALGTGPLFALGTGMVVGSAPPERAGAAASLSETANYFGGTLGIAVLGAVGAGIYGSGMADAAPDGGAAAQTVAGVAARAAQLPPAAAADLVREAHQAFTWSLHVLGVIGAALFVAAAAVLARWFPRTPS